MLGGRFSLHRWRCVLVEIKGGREELKDHQCPWTFHRRAQWWTFRSRADRVVRDLRARRREGSNRPWEQHQYCRCNLDDQLRTWGYVSKWVGHSEENVSMSVDLKEKWHIPELLKWHCERWKTIWAGEKRTLEHKAAPWTRLPQVGNPILVVSETRLRAYWAGSSLDNSNCAVL